jgi:two-component system KDP operon response regulator KdpE
MSRILLIEDDAQIRSLVSAALSEAGHVVDTAATAMRGLELSVDEAPDLVVLDLGLPDLDGADLLRMLRSVSTVPVVVATARDDEAEVIRLLDLGADDYIVKPYRAAQLEARIRAVLRRGAAADEERRISVGGLEIDIAARTAALDGVALELNRKEFDLLACLASREGEVVTREELFAEVWRQPYGGADKTIDVHMSWLRRKLGESAAEPRYLHTVRGVGVKLVAPT